ncbi:cysteine desulfurase IscS [Abditibacteriota bacterium]|nr:cysteine desulfurase IscS [Abditibacteriota bacterium]
MIYLDHAATTPLHPAVLDAMMPFFGVRFGNPSSLHHLGRDAKFALERAREQVATLLNARPTEIVFNSGATEGNNHALKGVASQLKAKGRHILASNIEHDAVLHPLQSLAKEGFDVEFVPVDSQGILNLEALESMMRPDTILVSLMHANNELGTIQPVEAVSALCRSRGVWLHVDACQTVGHITVDVKALGCDLLTLSAHKFYGPKGAGALYIRRGVRLETLVEGGHQQKGRRAGTENVAAIVGMGVACDLARTAMENGEEAGVVALRERFIDGVLNSVEGAYLNGHPTQRVPGIVNFSFAGIEGEGLILELDAKAGMCASTGSACAAGSLDPSPTLLAIGLETGLARAGTRFSLGRGTTEAEIDEVLRLMPDVVESLRALNPAARAALVGGRSDDAG